MPSWISSLRPKLLYLRTKKLINCRSRVRAVSREASKTNLDSISVAKKEIAKESRVRKAAKSSTWWTRKCAWGCRNHLRQINSLTMNLMSLFRGWATKLVNLGQVDLSRREKDVPNHIWVERRGLQACPEWADQRRRVFRRELRKMAPRRTPVMFWDAERYFKIHHLWESILWLMAKDSIFVPWRAATKSF